MTNIGMNYVTPEVEMNTQETTMTVYSALNKRKLYLDKLNKLKENGTKFLGYAPKSAVDIDGLKREDFENKCRAVYDKNVAIIRNFYNLNAAIAQSNAMTRLMIGGVEYTVQEAIVRYDRANAEIAMLNDIMRAVDTACAKVNNMNTTNLSEKAITDYVTKMMSNLPASTDENGLTVTTLAEMEAKFREDYINRNTYEVIDPYDHVSTIESKVEALKAFITEFNEALNICNMQTMITVNLVDDQNK